MKAASAACVVAAFALTSGIAFATDAPLDPTASEIAGELADKWGFDLKRDIGPFRLTAGPTAEGKWGSSFKGDGRQVFESLSSDPKKVVSEKGFRRAFETALAYESDASWNSDKSIADAASFSLKPTFDSVFIKVNENYAALAKASASSDVACKSVRDAARALLPVDIDRCLIAMPKAVFSFSPYLDLRYRFGQVKSDDSLVKVNQGLIGAGFSGVWFDVPSWTKPVIRQWPKISATYYTVVDSNSSADVLPDGIKADFFQLAISSKAEFLRLKENGPALLRFHVDYTASKSTEGPDKSWDGLTTLQFVYVTGTQLKPAITFKSGSEHSFDFDRSVLIGFLVDLVPS